MRDCKWDACTHTLHTVHESTRMRAEPERIRMTQLPFRDPSTVRGGHTGEVSVPVEHWGTQAAAYGNHLFPNETWREGQQICNWIQDETCSRIPTM